MGGISSRQAAPYDRDSQIGFGDREAVSAIRGYSGIGILRYQTAEDKSRNHRDVERNVLCPVAMDSWGIGVCNFGPWLIVITNYF
jgi:hypothetical protein